MKTQKWISFILVLILALYIGACNKNSKSGAPPAPESAPQTPATREVTLYFSDDQAMYLVAEKREVQLEKDDAQVLASAVINQLIAGPVSSKLIRTIPPECRLLSLKVENGLATVDFSRELQTRHWGGSTGEQHTLCSIVNSLTELPGVQKVQLLIEGEKQETLKGHMDISQPMTRDDSIIKK